MHSGSTLFEINTQITSILVVRMQTEKYGEKTIMLLNVSRDACKKIPPHDNLIW